MVGPEDQIMIMGIAVVGKHVQHEVGDDTLFADPAQEAVVEELIAHADVDDNILFARILFAADHILVEDHHVALMERDGTAVDHVITFSEDFRFF